MDSQKSNLNPSSLIDLKAELHKKYETFQKAKLSQKLEPVKSTSFRYKGQPAPKDKKTSSKITLKPTIEDNSEESLALKKSQLALEAKAKLYEKIISNNTLIDDEDNERYCVDFHRKVLYNTTAPIKPEIKPSNLQTQETSAATSHSSETLKDIYARKPVISDEKQNIPITEENQTDQPIHYQNVQFNEVREHGTGYFAFSMDESKRKEQMEELNRLHQETEQQRVAAQRMQRKRKAMLEARLAKVCERRNIDKSVVQSYTKTDEISDDLNQEEVELSSIPLPDTPEKQEKKEVKVRPWDVGKTNYYVPFVKEKQKTKSQNDWIENRRSERPSEFAPPTSYR